MAADWTTKVAATANTFDATLQDGTGAAVNINGAAVTITLVPEDDLATPKVNDAAVTNLDVDAATRGKIRWSPTAANIDTPGRYYGELSVLWPDTKVMKWPISGPTAARYFVIDIEASL